MGIGYSLTVGWQMLSFIVVLGSLAGIGYLMWDAHKEAQELAELKAQPHDLKYTNRYKVIG